jgi:SAM-dependent methyltransferase
MDLNRPAETLAMGQRIVAFDYNRGTPLPWWFKMGCRLVLPDLGVLGRIGHLFVSSADEDTDIDRLIDLFDTKFSQFRSARNRRPGSYLELGPGDTIARALVAAANGVDRIWLVDAGNYARRDMRHYHAVAADLTARGFSVPDLSHCRRLDDILRACRATYLTGGLASLREIADQSIDLIVSEAVLEHLPRAELRPFFVEFRRLMTPDGLALHGIDLDDHLDGGLNHLRFSDDTWEKPWIRNSGFYTNRFSHSQICAMARSAGLEVGEFYRLCWLGPRLPRGDLHPSLSGWTDQDLEICSFGLMLNPPGPDD